MPEPTRCRLCGQPVKGWQGLRGHMKAHRNSLKSRIEELETRVKKLEGGETRATGF